MADDSTDAVRDLINALEGADVTDEMIEWIRQVCTPEALVIDSMVKEFVEAFNTAQEDYCNSILKALLYGFVTLKGCFMTALRISCSRSSRQTQSSSQV